MNAIIRREEQQTALAPALSLEDLKERATLVVRAGLAPKGMTPEQLTITMLKGQEMGMGPMEAMESFYVVNGSVGSWTHQLVNRLRAVDQRISRDPRQRSAPGGVPGGPGWLGRVGRETHDYCRVRSGSCTGIRR